MISLQDVQVLEKLSSKLFIPFFAIACFLQPPFDFGLLSGSSVFILSVNFVLSFVVSVILLMITHEVIVYLDVYWFKEKLFPAAGLLCITFGLLILCKLSGKDPFAGVSFSWNLASLSYGFVIFQIIERINRHAAKKDLQRRRLDTAGGA